MENSNHKKGKFGVIMGGLLIGSMLGAGIALLSAPQSGMQTRMMLRDKGTEIGSKVKSSALETRSRVTTGLVNAQQRAETFIHKIGRTNPETIVEAN